MEFLDNLILPHSGTNLELLKFLLVLAQLIFLIFSGVLLGSAVMSYFFGSKARKTENPVHTRLTVDYIDLVLSGNMMAIGLGIVPLASIIMIYAQLLHNTSSNIVNLLIFSSAFYLLGLSFLLIYRRVANSSDIIRYIKTEFDNDKRAEYTPTVDSTLAVPGILTLFAGMWLFIGTISLTIDYNQWTTGDNLFNVLFSFQSIVKFLQYFTISLAITGLAFIVKTFYWDKPDNLNDEYSNYAKKYSASIAVVFAVIQPVFFVLDLTFTPKETVSAIPFALVLAAIVAIFILVNLVYVNLKSGNHKYAQFAFYLILLVFGLHILREQASFDTAAKEQILILATDYDEHEQALLEKMGKAVSTVNGEEIYQAKCSACHQFDVKLVGPPHKEVLMKYQGKEEEMVKFIMNPVKVNPDYPPMPAQGLTPKEAKAVVEFMYKHFGEKLK